MPSTVTLTRSRTRTVRMTVSRAKTIPMTLTRSRTRTVRMTVSRAKTIPMTLTRPSQEQ